MHCRESRVRIFFPFLYYWTLKKFDKGLRATGLRGLRERMKKGEKKRITRTPRVKRRITSGILVFAFHLDQSRFSDFGDDFFFFFLSSIVRRFYRFVYRCIAMCIEIRVCLLVVKALELDVHCACVIPRSFSCVTHLPCQDYSRRTLRPDFAYWRYTWLAGITRGRETSRKFRAFVASSAWRLCNAFIP